MAGWQGVIERYSGRMNMSFGVPPITLLEGNTPLIRAKRLADFVAPGAELYFKFEGLNPTGSFKDRGMTTAITKAVDDGAETVICASTGNTAASAAAYAARAGLKCVVLIPDGKIAMGKLAGAIAYGARVIAISGSFDDGLKMVREVADQSAIALVNSVNPARLEGQKTAAWEVEEQLGEVPDWLCLPVGNAGNITAYWMGFCQAGGKLPRLLGAQAEGSAPIVNNKRVDNPETIATAIRIGNPARWDQAVEALTQSNGLILAVSDEEILDAYRLVASREGVFCEPSSAAGIAGLRKAVVERGLNMEGKKVVCVLTGHGLKDPDTAIRDAQIQRVEATTDALLRVLE